MLCVYFFISGRLVYVFPAEWEGGALLADIFVFFFFYVGKHVARTREGRCIIRVCILRSIYGEKHEYCIITCTHEYVTHTIT